MGAAVDAAELVGWARCMTLSARNWAWSIGKVNAQNEPIAFREKLTLLCLAELENAELGYAYPSQKHIAKMTCQSERTVRSHLAELKRLGLISSEKARSERGRWDRDVYILNVSPEYREKDSVWMGHQEGQW